MIKVHCRTNLDDFKREVWPEQFSCRPMLGDFVQSESGARLRIVEITHSRRKVYDRDDPTGRQKYEPILIIELQRDNSY